MKAIIYFTIAGIDDSFIIEGTNELEIRDKADIELAKIGGKDPYSEIVEE